MKPYCLNCRKDTENKKFRVILIVQQWYDQNVQYAVVKNQDLLKSEKQNDYYVM